MKEELIILGIDPGTFITGFGFIKIQTQKMSALDYGCIRPPLKFKLTDRYLIIFDALNELIEKYKPHHLAVETQFVQKNVQSAIKLGMARGIAIIAAKKMGIPVYEYSPSKAKLAVTGTGKAAKSQVQCMIGKILQLAKTVPEDAADALALAVCHAHSLQTSYILGQEI